MTLRYRFILTLVILVLISVSFQGVKGQTPPRNATGYTRYIEVYQGDIPDTPTIESPSMLTVRDAMIYVIPWNVSRVYNSIPAGANLTYFLDVHSMIANSGVSTYPNWYYWEFPPGTYRGISTELKHNTSVDFAQGSYDSSIIDVSGDTVKLNGSALFGDFTSQLVDVTEGLDVTSARLNISSTNLANVNMQVSNNNGTNWFTCSNNTYVNFTVDGTQILYNLNLTGNPTPVIDSITMDFNYTPASTSLALMAEYTFSSVQNPPEFSFIKNLLYGINPAQIIVYTEIDTEYDVQTGSQNIDWLGHWDIDMTVYEKEGKTLAGMGTIEPGESFTLSLEAIGSPGISNSMYIFAFMIIAIAIGCILILKGINDRKKSQPKKEIPDESEEEIEEPEKPEISDDTREALLERKGKTLRAIKRLDSDFEEGVLSEDVYLELKDKYKKEAINIMKELDGPFKE
jgi:hypothetical protein